MFPDAAPVSVISTLEAETTPSGPVSCPANTRQDVWEEVEVATEPLPVNPLSHTKTAVPPAEWRESTRNVYAPVKGG